MPNGKRGKLTVVFLVELAAVLGVGLMQANAAPSFDCGWVPESSGACRDYPILDSHPELSDDTVKAVALYVSTSTASSQLLPSWWAKIWNADSQNTVPRFYKDNSLGKHKIEATPFGRTPDSCFKYRFSYFDAGFSTALFDSIILQADPVINFRNFDHNNDDTVDGVFFVIVNEIQDPDSAVGDAGFYPGYIRTTTDISANGRPMVIDGRRTAYVLVPTETWGVSACAHEWGHVLGLPDLYFGGGPAGHGIGSFSTMSRYWPENRTVPFDPWSRWKLGWADTVEVTSPLYQQSIPDYLTTGKVYRLSKDGRQYFLITNHKGVDPEIVPAGFWEAKLPPRGGLLIWHVDTARCRSQAPNEEFIDVELAHGLWNFINFQPDTLHPNDSTGKDSLDITGFGYTLPSLASATCWWNDSTKKTFDGLSNPSSDAYRDVKINDVYWQDIPTHLAVRKIQAGNFSSAMADLLVNNWYGHITQNTTWSGFVAMTGDVTVDSGFTLTIQPGTVVYAQYNEDNQRTGADTTRCEIIVKPGGRLVIGGAGSPVKFVSSRPENLAGTEDWRGIVVKPGGYLSISNAVIRHAYAGIEDSSRYLHTIKNVRIGRCKMYGIAAFNTDSLTIRGCRVDSVRDSSGGGHGIYVSGFGGARKGAKLIKDTTWGCYRGITAAGGTSPIESCLVQGRAGLLPSHTGITAQLQPFGGDSLAVNFTTINGYFSNQHFENSSHGNAALNGCVLSSATSPYRSPYGIRSTSIPWGLRVRNTTIIHWGSTGVLLTHNGPLADLGSVSSPADSGFNTVYTGALGTGWKYVYDQDCGSCPTPVIKAEYNCWAAVNPSSTRFSGNIDRTPVDYSCMEAPKIAAGGGETAILPKPTELFQNYPNPFNPTTLIQFNLEKPEKVNLEIFNILGQKVRTMLSGEEFAAGPYTFLWDGKDNRGSPLSSGMYFYRLSTPSFLQTKKMALVK